MMAPDVLIIGTGLTSALSAAQLQKVLPKVKITIWDKARTFGGRMYRSVSPTSSNCSADLGAQYITTTVEVMQKNEDIYNPLMEKNIIENLTCNILGMKKYSENTKNFVAPGGMCSLVKYFLRDIPPENIRFSSRVVSIDEENGKLRVASKNYDCLVDVVISTMPIPQFLDLQGSSIKANVDLKSVEYSSRFALILFYDEGIAFPATEWACQYMDHEVLRYVAIDNLKRNRPSEPVAVVFHTSVAFGKENLEKAPADLESLLMGYVKALFPEWPKPSATKCHKWRFSQVIKPFEGKPGCFVLRQKPTLILGGDAFTESNFDGCVYSASKIVEAVCRNWSA